MGFVAQDGAESVTHLRGTKDALEVKDNGSCIAFINVQAFSLKETDCAGASDLTEVS